MLQKNKRNVNIHKNTHTQKILKYIRGKSHQTHLDENEETHKEIKVTKPTLFNLPKTVLSKYQSDTLLQGLTFTPMAKRNVIQLKCDFITFTC